MRWRGLFENKLRQVGFSARAARVVATCPDLKSIEDLQLLAWDGREGLKAILGDLPGCGRKVLAEVKAFKDLGDPRLAESRTPAQLSVELPPSDLVVLDQWIVLQKKPPSRQAAVRMLISAELERIASKLEHGVRRYTRRTGGGATRRPRPTSS